MLIILSSSCSSKSGDGLSGQVRGTGAPPAPTGLSENDCALDGRDPRVCPPVPQEAEDSWGLEVSFALPLELDTERPVSVLPLPTNVAGYMETSI